MRLKTNNTSIKLVHSLGTKNNHAEFLFVGHPEISLESETGERSWILNSCCIEIS